ARRARSRLQDHAARGRSRAHGGLAAPRRRAEGRDGMTGAVKPASGDGTKRAAGASSMAPPMPFDRGEIQRKVLHIAMGGFAFLLAWLTWWEALALAVIALLHNLYVLPHYARSRIFRGEARTKGRDLGIVLYPASIAVLILVLHTRLEIVAAAWGLLAFGDGFATLAGRGVGGPRLPWNRAKTWTGFGAFLFMGFTAAWFL